MRFAAPLLLLSLLLMAGCASHSRVACPTASPTRSARVFFATDRKASDGAGRSLFGATRTDPPALQMGSQQIALGPGHRIGLLDTPVAVSPANVTARADGTANERPMPYRTDAEIRTYVNTKLRAAIRSSPAPAAGRKQVLLFIHGFNSDFNYSVRKTAQLAGDLDLVTCTGQARGVAVAYSWPSRASLLGYLSDEEDAEWTQQRLVPFLLALSDMAREESAELQIIAHSMGTRIAIRSLAQIAMMRGGAGNQPIASNVILLAPDISRSLFDQYFARFVGLIGHLTIYVSAKDHALAISSFLHPGQHRLGFLESTILTALQITQLSRLAPAGEDHRELGASVERASGTRKIDMIDVSHVLADPIGHSYEDPAFIADLRELIYRHTPADSRPHLEPRQARPELFGLHGQSMHYFQLKAR